MGSRVWLEAETLEHRSNICHDLQQQYYVTSWPQTFINMGGAKKPQIPVPAPCLANAFSGQLLSKRDAGHQTGRITPRGG